MARKKGGLAALAIVVLAAALLVALNPTQADFKSYMERSAASNAKEKTSGAIGDLFGSISAGVAGAVSSAYERSNFLVCSSYVSRAADGSAKRSYLGIAKLFIRLK